MDSAGNGSSRRLPMPGAQNNRVHSSEDPVAPFCAAVTDDVGVPDQEMIEPLLFPHNSSSSFSSSRPDNAVDLLQARPSNTIASLPQNPARPRPFRERRGSVRSSRLGRVRRATFSTGQKAPSCASSLTTERCQNHLVPRHGGRLSAYPADPPAPAKTISQDLEGVNALPSNYPHSLIAE